MSAFGSILVLLFLGDRCFAATSEDSAVRKRDSLFKITSSECPANHFRCRDKTCLPRTSFCNGDRECDSDEELCENGMNCSRGTFNCRVPEPSWYTTSRYDTTSSYRYFCRPVSKLCNGENDCYDSIDESLRLCSSILLDTSTSFAKENKAARTKAVQWLLGQRNGKRVTYKWGPEVARISVALHLANSFEKVSNYESIRDELAYELNNRLLARMALKPLQDVSTTELASSIHAFLATCVNPKDFEVTDLVAELRRRKDASKYTNPYVVLVLCNAGDIVKVEDIENLQLAFSNSKRNIWTDNRALILMALSCAAQQPNPLVDVSEIQDLSQDIKRKQYRNGTVQNLKTTALVLQALFATDPDSDSENFDEERALKQILLSQKEDGSFGSVANTYYALPVLAGLSLVNVTNGHCDKLVRNEKETVNRLINRAATKWSIGVSIWIGDNRTLERSLTVTVPVNTTAFTLMETAADLDDRFKFQYNVVDRKPYIYSISGFQDDPERGLYWFQHIRTNSNDLTQINQSPGEVIPSKDQHLIYWYKHGPWTMEKRETEETKKSTI